MNFDDERAAVEKHLTEQWAANPLSSSVKLYVDNGVAVAPAPPYIQVFVENTGTEQKTPGPPDKPVWWNITGFIQVDIYTAVGAGSSQARKIADAVSGIFLRKQLEYGASGKLVCKEPTQRSLGQREGKDWRAVRVPFYRRVHK